MAINLVEGWTGRIIYQLVAAGVVQDLSGASVELILYDRNSQPVSLSGSSDVLDAEEGKVYFDPAEDDLVAARIPYSARWKVTDGVGKVAFFPNGEPERWHVRKP